MYVCLCNGVTERDIRQIAMEGCRSMSELTMRTGCGAGCGSCVQAATALLDEVHAEQTRLRDAVGAADAVIGDAPCAPYAIAVAHAA